MAKHTTNRSTSAARWGKRPINIVRQTRTRVVIPITSNRPDNVRPQSCFSEYEPYHGRRQFERVYGKILKIQQEERKRDKKDRRK